MAERPIETVTFLFTDIEGSTRLLLRVGERYVEALDDHGRLIGSAVARFGGTVFGSEGDAVFAAFSEAPRAVEAAIEAQRALAAHDWPEGGSVRVRMGLHTGEATVGSTGYAGIDVHRAARVSDAGHGGQILVTEAVRLAIEPTLAKTITLRDLGEHRLKDLPEPMRLYQVEVPDLPSDFAPLRSLEARPNNLPQVLSEFIGREEEVEEVARLLGRHRLVTLLGVGGSGKTRLALRVAGDALARFRDGVFFVPLEAITDPSLVASAIVQAVGISNPTNRPVEELLDDELAEKHLLLVLDNFEQILPAAPLISRLCETAPNLYALVTSRAPLHLSGEHSFEVPPLTVPDPEGETMNAVGQADAAALFVRRCQAIDGDFVLSAENAQTVAEIVTRLDGLPLAIELAAARTRYLTLAALADALETSLVLLDVGPADAPERHRTLRATLAWSHDLLDSGEQKLFRRLGIFVGGFTPAAAEAVAAGIDQRDITKDLASLIDHSLVSRRIMGGDARFYLLETVRQFAVEQLIAAGEREALADRHAAFYLTIAQEAERELARDSQAMWIDHLSSERDNLRAALRYAAGSDQPDLGLRLAGAIWRYWHGSGQLAEGMGWLERFLAHPKASVESRARGLTAVAGLAYWQTDYERAWANYEGALELYRSIGDQLNEADTLYAMSMTASLAGDPEVSGPLAVQAKAMFEEIGDREGLGKVLLAQAQTHWMKGELAQARPLWEESLAISLELGNRVVAASQLCGLAGIEFAQGNEAAALHTALKGMEMALDAGSLPMAVLGLEVISVSTAPREPAHAVRLAGAAAALREVVGGHTIEPFGVPTAIDQARSVLEEGAIEYEWHEGNGMSLERAVGYARWLADTVTTRVAR